MSKDRIDHRQDGRCSMSACGLIASACLGCGTEEGEDQADVTSTSSAINSITGSIRAYIRSDGADAVVTRQRTFDVIYELTGNPDFRTAVDLHARAHESALTRSSPWGYKRSDNVNSAVWIGTDGHVHGRNPGAWQ